jgi:hypothetical protein
MNDQQLHAYTNDEEWVIAASPEDADKVCEQLGMGATYAADTSQWVLCDPAKLFTFDDGDATETKTLGEWITIKGRGYFASSNY